LIVTLKTTEQNRIVCTSKSEAKVTNNKKLHLTTINTTKLSTDRHEASHSLFATAEFLVKKLKTSKAEIVVMPSCQVLGSQRQI